MPSPCKQATELSLNHRRFEAYARELMSFSCRWSLPILGNRNTVDLITSEFIEFRTFRTCRTFRTGHTLPMSRWHLFDLDISKGSATIGLRADPGAHGTNGTGTPPIAIIAIPKLPGPPAWGAAVVEGSGFLGFSHIPPAIAEVFTVEMLGKVTSVRHRCDATAFLQRSAFLPPKKCCPSCTRSCWLQLNFCKENVSRIYCHRIAIQIKMPLLRQAVELLVTSCWAHLISQQQLKCWKFSTLPQACALVLQKSLWRHQLKSLCSTAKPRHMETAPHDTPPASMISWDQLTYGDIWYNLW